MVYAYAAMMEDVPFANAHRPERVRLRAAALVGEFAAAARAGWVVVPAPVVVLGHDARSVMRGKNSAGSTPSHEAMIEISSMLRLTSPVSRREADC